MRLGNHLIKYLLDQGQSRLYNARSIKNGGYVEDYHLEKTIIDLLTVSYKMFFVSKSVIESFDLMHIKGFDWTYFQHLPNKKLTFIFPDDSVIRLNILEEELQISSFQRSDGGTKIKTTYTFINKTSGNISDPFDHSNENIRAGNTSFLHFIYKLLCFFFLSKNDEIVIPAGKKHLGRKDPNNLLNELDIPVTVVTSRWNTTVIRTEGFPVAGHFAIRLTGKNRQEPRIVWIDPFTKNGYVRKAQKSAEDNISHTN